MSSDPNDARFVEFDNGIGADERIDVYPGRDVHVRGRRERDLVALVLTRRYSPIEASSSLWAGCDGRPK